MAHSDFRAQGWAVAEGVEDTEVLCRYVVARYGRPTHTFIVGHSMGGLIAVATVERYPEAYDGALPLCAPLTPALDFMAERLFGLLVAVDALVPGALPAGQGLTDPTAPSIADPAVALNRAVRRHRADAAAVAYLRQHYSPTGRLARPVLAMHTTYDPIVAPRFANAYASVVARAGAQDRFVARIVAADGHCAIAPAETAAAFDALRAWAGGGPRPAGGESR